MTLASGSRRRPPAFQLDPQSQVVGGIGVADRGFVADPAGFVQIEQGIIESHDALFAGTGPSRS